MFDLKSHLQSLVESHAPSGHESPIRELIRDAWKDLTDKIEQDRLGSLIGIKRATEPMESPRKIMLAAHMDEIGMMVRDVVNGFVYIHRVSGVDNRVMLAQQVLVHGKRSLPGIVAAVPPHLLEASATAKYPAFNEMVVDIGLPPDEVADLVSIGDLITVDVPMIELQGGKVAAKTMDDRACVAAVTVCLDYLKGMRHQWDVYAVATVQEEVGLRGATTAAHYVEPDIAIALDVGFAAQSGVDADESIELGGGPGIGVGPNFHPGLHQKLQDTASKYEIKLQDDIIPGASGTDAWAIQVAREGIPTALLEVPIRNMHSPVETLDLKDIDRAGRLMAHFIAGLDADFLTAIDWSDLKDQAEGA